MKELSEADRQKLDQLNTAVDDAIAERTKWLDEKMPEYAVIKVGEPIFDLESGEELGVVTELYRYYAEHDVRFDREMSIDYVYRTRAGDEDNTSRQGCLMIGTRQQAIDEQRDKLRFMETRP